MCHQNHQLGQKSPAFTQVFHRQQLLEVHAVLPRLPSKLLFNTTIVPQSTG